MRLLLLATVTVGLGMSAALGRNVINEHSGYYQRNVHYSVVQDVVGNDVAVLIRKNSVWSQIWRFEAFDDVTQAPGYINYIRIQPTGPVGLIRLRVAGKPPHAFGARDVKEIDLLVNADNTTEVHSVHISGDLGETWGVAANKVGAVYCAGNLLPGGIFALGACTGNITIGGDARGSIVAATIEGAIAVSGDLLSSIRTDSLANLTVNGSGPHTGNITVRHAYSHDVTIARDYAGDMSFLQSVSGEVEVMDDLFGSIVVANDLTGRIVVRNDVMAGGLIAVEGDANGFITAGRTLAGRIRVDGSLLNSPSANDIWIGTGLDTTGATAIDWDGWDAADTWAAGAVVRVGVSAYTQNTPAARVYEITECKGDMNNDELVDFGDINPFVLALSNPAGFGDAHPGLDGSMVYHGDLSCDDLFDFADVNPFVLRLAQGCCKPTCGHCPGFGLAAPPPPAKLAATLKAHTAPALYDALLDIVAETPLWQSDPAQRKYREGVYDELVK